MEDELGDAGLDSRVGVSEPPSSGNLANETLVGSMAGVNEVEESYEDGDGDEIMIEVVGSDVFVDGVSAHKEDDAGDVGGLEVHVWDNSKLTGTQDLVEAMDVSSETDGNKVEEIDSGFPESIGAGNCISSDEVDAGFHETAAVEGGAVSEVFLTRVGVSIDENEAGQSDVGFSGLRDREDYVVTEEAGATFIESFNVQSGAVSELSLRQVGILGDPACNHGIEPMVVSSSAAEPVTGEAKEVVGRTPLVIGEEKTVKDEVVDNGNASLVTPELANHPVASALEGNLGVSDKEGVVLLNDNAGGHGHLGADPVTSQKSILGADGGQVVHFKIPLDPNVKSSNNVQVEGINSVVGHGGPVFSDREFSDSIAVNNEGFSQKCPKDGVSRPNAESASTDSDCVPEPTMVNEREILAAEGKNIELKSDVLVCDIQDENQGCLNELHVVKCGELHKIDGVPHASQKSIFEKSSCSDGVEVSAAEFDDVQGCKNEASDINIPDISCASNEQCLKTNEHLETEEIHQNHVFSTEPSELDNGGDTAGLIKLDGLNIVIQADKEEKQANTASQICPGVETVKTDSGMSAGQPMIVTLVAEDIYQQEMEVSQVEAVSRDGSGENGKNVDPEISVQTLGCQGAPEIPAIDSSKENVNHLTENVHPGVAAVSDIGHSITMPQRAERAKFHVSNTEVPLLDQDDIKEALVPDVATSSDYVNKSIEREDTSSKPSHYYGMGVHTLEIKATDMEEKESGRKYHEQKEVFDESEIGAEEPASETDSLKLYNEETEKSGSSLRMDQSGYLLPPENEGQFSVSDLVWGKVRSHPWWPGQIFDPADASEIAVKYYKKDSFLVAYFGDRTFAWNDASVLKPFRLHFSQIENQSNSEAFQNAVHCALEEVSRRVELGLACPCIPKDAYDKIAIQVVENTGLHEGSSRRYGMDPSCRAASFEPDKLLEYVRDLAPRACSGADRLDLVIVRAQLSAFCRFKGYCLPMGFPASGELLENDADNEHVTNGMVASNKFKHTPKDTSESRKERSLTELMSVGEHSLDAEDESFAEDVEKSVGRKRKALDPLADGSDKRLNVYAAKVSSQTPKPSFKIGECIRRVASQLTGSGSFVKGHSDEMVIDSSPMIYEHPEKRSMVASAESSSVNEMLSQLQMLAQDPKKGHNLQTIFTTFFLGFRSSIALNRRCRKKKAEPTVGGSGEEFEFEFEFDDVNDSYWTDRIVQNYSEEQLLHNSENGAGNLQLVPLDAEKSTKLGRKPYSRKRYSTVNYLTETTESDENVKRRKESSPAELILNFAERKCVPSEINLNKMFRRFGPLMESETEVDHDSGRAKVIFKRGSDAEVAHSSAEKFNIFGTTLVNYQIGYSPLISVRILPVPIPQAQEDANLLV